MSATVLQRQSGFDFMRRNVPVGGRPLKGNERMGERLPPIYVTPTFKRELDAFREAEGIEFAELGREAIETYVAGKKALVPKANHVTFELIDKDRKELENEVLSPQDEYFVVWDEETNPVPYNGFLDMIEHAERLRAERLAASEKERRAA